MIKGVAILLLFQLLGESLVFITHLPLPGPVVGLVFLFAAMQMSRTYKLGVLVETERVADGFLKNLGLLFVPAGVGIVAMWGQLQSQAGVLLAILLTSVILTLAVTVWTFIAVQRITGGDRS